MGFSDAFINVHLIYQYLFVQPFYYSTSTNKILVHPKRNLPLRKRLLKMPLWLASYLVAIAVLVYCVLSLNSLAGKFNKNQTSDHYLQLIWYGCGAGISTQALITIYTIDQDPFYFMLVVRDIFNVGNVRCNKFPTTDRPPDFQEIMGYGIAIGLLNFPLATALMPFVFPVVDPIDRINPSYIPVLQRKVVCSLCYTFVCFYCASICASFLLLMLTCCHIFEKLTYRNFLYCQNAEPLAKPNLIERLSLQLVMKGLKVLEFLLPQWKAWNRPSDSYFQEKVFNSLQSHPNGIKTGHSNSKTIQKCRLVHNMLYIIMTPCNYNVELFIPVMSGVGMALCVFLNFAISSLYSQTHLWILCLLALNINIAIHWLIEFLCLHASLPAIYTEKTIHYLRQNVSGSIAKRQVRAMRGFGFSMGAFFTAKRRTAIDMFQTIITYTASLLVFYR